MPFSTPEARRQRSRSEKSVCVSMVRKQQSADRGVKAVGLAKLIVYYITLR
jgi:hypothetical protein